jgi:hypothetical protein
MPSVGIEPTIPAFERAKTVHALDRAATVIGGGMAKLLKLCMKVYINWNYVYSIVYKSTLTKLVTL